MPAAAARIEEWDQQRKGSSKYVYGRTLGEGSFGKVKLACHVDTGREFAVKILDKKRGHDLHIDDQIKKEVKTLRLLRHPNVVRLHEVFGSKTKVYIVLDYVSGGELFDKIASGGRLKENQARKIFQQIIDAVSYCHDNGVYHRDLKPENILLDSEGNIKISDFGLSTLPAQLKVDGLLHTRCGSPNYVAPEVLENKKGYHGAASDIWSCGVILYVILTGRLPFEDSNLLVLYQKILKGAAYIPIWLSCQAIRLLQRILDPNPSTRITMDEIKSDPWFRDGYVPAMINGADADDDDEKECENKSEVGFINAFELIGMSSGLDLSALFQTEEISDKRVRFTSTHSHQDLFNGINGIVTDMGFHVHHKHKKLKIASANPNSFSAEAQIIEFSPFLHVVELKKSCGDLSLYEQLCKRLSVVMVN